MQIEKINIVCAYYVPHVGGVEKFAKYQSRELNNLGFKVNIITSNTEKSPFFEDTGNIKIYRISSFLSSKIPMPIPWNIFQIIKIFFKCFIGRKTLTIVHTRYYPISLIGVVFGRISGSRLIVIDHSSGYIEFDSPLINRISHIHENIMTFIVKLFRPGFYGVSKSSNKWVKKFGINAKGVYYNGIDYEHHIEEVIDVKKKYNIDKYVFYGGRFIKEKGILELLEAFDQLSKKRNDIHLIVAGSGLLENEVKEYAAKNNKIIYVGRLAPDEIFNYIRDSYVLVNPSNYPEGLPTILLEAGKSHTAVISTPNGGAKEVITNNETGILIGSGKSDLILNAIEKLLNDENLRNRMAENLQELVRNHFDWPIITKEFIFNTLKLDHEKN